MGLIAVVHDKYYNAAISIHVYTVTCYTAKGFPVRPTSPVWRNGKGVAKSRELQLNKKVSDAMGFSAQFFPPTFLLTSA